MPRLPILSGKKLLKILQQQGFREIRRKGSHVFIEGLEKNISTVIPVHGNEDLGKGLLKSILNDLEIEVKDLLDWMR